MSSAERVEKAKKAIVEAEIRLRTHEVEMDALMADAASLRRAMEILSSNEEFLKEPGLVVSVQEYKKIRQDIASLIEQKDRMVFTMNQCSTRIDESARSLEGARALLDYELSKEKRKVVNLFPRRTDG